MNTVGGPPNPIGGKDLDFNASGETKKSNPESAADPVNLAKELFEKHKAELYGPWKNYEGPDGAEMPNHAIQLNLLDVPDEELENYWGHGITKGEKLDHLAAIIDIAMNNRVNGWTGRLNGGQFGAYTNGSFLVLSPPGQQLMRENDGQPVLLEDGSWEANIGMIVINDFFYPLADELQSRFPGVKFIKARDLVDYFAGDTGSITSE